MQGVQLLRVRPAEKTVTTVLRHKISPEMIAQLVGTSDLRACEIGGILAGVAPTADNDEFPLCAVHRRWDFQYGLTLPRWQMTGMPVMFGEAILFGRNSKGRAAGCPLTSSQAFKMVEWLPPVASDTRSAATG